MKMLFSDIVIGALSGVIGTGILLLIRFYYIEKIVPWYKKIKQTGLNIDGSWKEIHIYEKGLLQDSDIKIYQFGNEIKGKISLTKKIYNSKKEIDFKIFDLTGTFDNNYLSLICNNSDKTQIGKHCYLLKSNVDGRFFSGSKIFLDMADGKIKSTEVSWERKNLHTAEKKVVS